MREGGEVVSGWSCVSCSVLTVLAGSPPGLELTGVFWPAASQAWPGQGSQAQSDNVVTQ